MVAEAPHALGPAAGRLVESDLTRLPICRGALQFLFYEKITEMHRLDLQNHSLASPDPGGRDSLTECALEPPRDRCGPPCQMSAL